MQYFKYETNGEKVKNSLVYDATFDGKSLTLTYIDDFWFKREIDGLGLILEKSYSPKILNIDEDNRSITLEHGVNLNHGLFENNLPDDWKEQVLFVVEDLEKSKIYKFNLYPHTFMFVDNKIKLIDLYACAANYEKIKYEDIEAVIRPDSKKRFSFLDDGYLNLEEIYNYGKNNNVGNWPGDFLNG